MTANSMTADSMTAVTAPLSLFLTRFSAPPPTPVPVFEVQPSASVPMVTLPEAELDARLAIAAEESRAEADQLHATEIADLALAHGAAMTDALAKARTEWAEAAGERFAAHIDTQVAELRAIIADRLAHVLRPLLAETIRARTIQAVMDALDRLLADPAKPAIQVVGPDDLLVAMRERQPAPGIEWLVADTAEVTVTTSATHIETKLAAALAEIAATETSHVC